HELEARLAKAEASSIAAQAGLAEQLETQHQDLLKLDAALQEAQASQSVVMADRDEVTRWAHELEARLAKAEASSMPTQAGLAEQLEARQQDLLMLDAALQEAQASQSVVMADRDELTRWAHELEAKLAQAEASMYRSNLQLADAFEQLGQMKDERRVVDTELLGLHAQVGDLLAQLGDASHASAQDAKTIASLNDEIVRWKEQQTGLRKQSKNLQSSYEQAMSDNDHLRRARQDLTEEVSRKAQEIALAERDAAVVAQLLAARIAEVERLHRSRSWRLTSPLRWVSGLLGAFRRRGVSGTIKRIALRHSSSAGREKMDSCADGKSSLPKTAPTIQDVLLSKHIEALDGVRRKIRQRLDDEDKGR
ncbi:hypothetical protein IMW82_08615, partial [Rhodanobacter sp. B2A1Ga4]|uniref:hypothetical protein n=1 Tax=Rhodanobacter sp. B2A1Ga4 TaxID=2778647 RepID=UPI001B35E34A